MRFADRNPLSVAADAEHKNGALASSLAVVGGVIVILWFGVPALCRLIQSVGGLLSGAL